MTRAKEIMKEADKAASANTQIIGGWGEHYLGFIHGAEWADSHPHWISVEDELPKNFKIVEDSYYAGKFEETDIVMVAFDDGDFGFARYVHDFPNADEGEAWYWFAEGNLSGVNLDDGDITHWMPLPQPPKKGGEK